MTTFNRKIYFDSVRSEPFTGKLTQQQVDGQEAILDGWEDEPNAIDLRHLAYMLATTLHETASEMWPIEEYGKGSGQPYGVPDPETGQTYYGRGFVQLTWRDNYAYATKQLGLTGADDLEWHTDRALDLTIATQVLYYGMTKGWFRSGNDGKPETLARYFDADTDDPYNAREIINGDKYLVPSWSNGVDVGNIIAGYHDNFLAALRTSAIPKDIIPTLTITTTGAVAITVNGTVITTGHDTRNGEPK